MRNLREKTVKFVVKEWVLLLSLLGLIVTECIKPRIPHYSYGDFKILFSLFVMLIVVKGLTETNFFKFLALRLRKGKLIGHKLVALTAALSMFLTNDVALIITIPVTLLMDLKDVEKLIVLEIAAANAGSSLTPFGNPQNLFIYYHYNVEFWRFIREIFPFSAITTATILILTPKVNNEEKVESTVFRTESYILLAFLLTFILSVTKLIPLWANIPTVLYALTVRRKFLKVDYFLLLTFFVFFGFTDNLAQIINVKLNSPRNVFLYSAVGSQFISNVPSALLFGDFTNNWRALLWGVNVGGFGTIIASLANLIGYRLYRSNFQNKRKFLTTFHAVNFALLLLGALVFLISSP